MRLALLLLTACGPTLLSATPRYITFDHVRKTNMADAAQQAQAHCAQFGRDAEYVPEGDPGVVTFRCVDRKQ